MRSVDSVFSTVRYVFASRVSSLEPALDPSMIGFGEVGAVDANGNRITNTATASAYLQRYYTMPITEPGYVGGHFWWYYVEDMLPVPSTMYSALAAAIQ
jgi:hypothetical protein